MSEYKKLRDIAIVAAGQGAPQGENNYTDTGIPFIKAGNLVELLSGKKESDVQKVNESVARKYRLKLYPAGTILFAKSGMSCMKGYVYRLQSDCYVVSHLACITPFGVSGEYLKYYFEYHSPNMLVKDEAYPSISLSDIGNLDIKVASITEQEEVVDRLARIRRVIRYRRNQIKKIDNLVKSQFIEMFEGEKYPDCPIKELVAGQVESVRKRYKPDDRIHYVDISSIDNKLNQMTGYTEYRLQEAPSRAQQCIVKGDILVSTVRPNLRNIAMNTFDDDHMVASSGFCVLRATSCNRSYLLVALLLDRFSRKMSELTTGANYPAIKDSDVLGYRIPRPPIEMQNKFAHFVEQTDKSKFRIKQSLEKLEILYKALLQKYFG